MLTPCDRVLKAADSASAAAAAASWLLIPDQSLRTGRCQWRTLRKKKQKKGNINASERVVDVAATVAVARPHHLCRRTRTAWTGSPPSPGPAESERRWRWRGWTGSGRSGSDLFSGSGTEQRNLSEVKDNTGENPESELQQRVCVCVCFLQDCSFNWCLCGPQRLVTFHRWTNVSISCCNFAF